MQGPGLERQDKFKDAEYEMPDVGYRIMSLNLYPVSGILNLALHW
jgi:hypothetical protein